MVDCTLSIELDSRDSQIQYFFYRTTRRFGAAQTIYFFHRLLWSEFSSLLIYVEIYGPSKKRRQHFYRFLLFQHFINMQLNPKNWFDENSLMKKIWLLKNWPNFFGVLKSCFNPFNIPDYQYHSNHLVGCGNWFWFRYWKMIYCAHRTCFNVSVKNVHMYCQLTIWFNQMDRKFSASQFQWEQYGLVVV